MIEFGQTLKSTREKKGLSQSDIAAKILDMLTERGIVGPQQGMGPRQIVMSQDELVAILNGNDSADAANGEPSDPGADGATPEYGGADGDAYIEDSETATEEET